MLSSLFVSPQKDKLCCTKKEPENTEIGVWLFPFIFRPSHVFAYWRKAHLSSTSCGGGTSFTVFIYKPIFKGNESRGLVIAAQQPTFPWSPKCQRDVELWSSIFWMINGGGSASVTCLVCILVVGWWRDLSFMLLTPIGGMRGSLGFSCGGAIMSLWGFYWFVNMFT